MAFIALPPTWRRFLSAPRSKSEYMVPEIVFIFRSALVLGGSLRSIKPLIVWALIWAVLPEILILPSIVSTEKPAFSGINISQVICELQLQLQWQFSSFPQQFFPFS